MSRIFLMLTLCLAGVAHSLQADDRAAEAAARAQREEAEERYKLLNGKLENVTETQELLLKNQEKMRQRIEALASEIEDIKRAQIRGAANTVTPEQLNALVEKLKEIDQKRIADNEHVLKALGDLQKMPVGPIPSAAEKSSSAKATEATGQFWDYVVRPNDTLQKIVIGYNRAPEMRGLAKLTVADVLKANPGLNQDKLYVGKKLLIPVPPKKEGKTGKGKAND